MRISSQLPLACYFLLLSSAVATTEAQVHHVREMNTEQIRALDRNTTAVILPGGIIEEHGPYLPAYSDGYMNERLTQELADAIVARPGWKALVFPVVPLGAHGANIIGRKYAFPGSYTLRMATLRAVFMDLASQLGQQGFRWVFVVHLHGAPEHNRALDQAADFFRDTYGGHMVHLTGLMSVFSELEGRTEEEAAAEGFTVHGGMGEHSLNLYLRPDRVSPDYEEAPAQRGQGFEDLARLARAGGWPGFFGTPSAASAAHGARAWTSFSEAALAMALRILDGYDYGDEPRYADLASTDTEVSAINRDALAEDRRIERQQTEWLRDNGLE